MHPLTTVIFFFASSISILLFVIALLPPGPRVHKLGIWLDAPGLILERQAPVERAQLLRVASLFVARGIRIGRTSVRNRDSIPVRRHIVITLGGDHRGGTLVGSDNGFITSAVISCPIGPVNDLDLAHELAIALGYRPIKASGHVLTMDPDKRGWSMFGMG